MRILFAAPGLELGRDGVGDYCRRLAEQMSLLGHSVALLSLNDSGALEDQGWVMAGDEPCVARLPAHLPAKDRWDRARQLIAAFDPEWISLHFVCYGFHPRGLVGGMADDFVKLVAGRKLHLMMHELWVMWGMKCRLPDRLIGVLQKKGVLKVLHALKPKLMDTTLLFYQAVLRKEGFDCGILPLCGNFSPVHRDAQSWLAPRLAEAGLSSLWPRKEPLLVAGFFGTIFGHWDALPLLMRLAEIARSAGKEILLLSGGKCSAAGERLFDQLPEQVSGVRFHKIRLGALTMEQASEYLNTLNLGLSCYSKLFVGKSSTAATMLDHGLTVLAGGNDSHLERFWELDQERVRGVMGLNDPWAKDLEYQSGHPERDSSLAGAIQLHRRLEAFA